MNKTAMDPFFASRIPTSVCRADMELESKKTMSLLIGRLSPLESSFGHVYPVARGDLLWPSPLVGFPEVWKAMRFVYNFFAEHSCNR